MLNLRRGSLGAVARLVSHDSFGSLPAAPDSPPGWRFPRSPCGGLIRPLCIPQGLLAGPYRPFPASCPPGERAGPFMRPALPSVAPAAPHCPLGAGLRWGPQPARPPALPRGEDSRPPVCFGPVRLSVSAASIQVPVNQTSVPERRLVGRVASAAFGGPLPGYSLGRAAWAGRRRADPVLRLVRSPTRNSGSCGLSLFRMSGRGYKKWHPVPVPSRVYCRIRQLLCSS